MIEARELGRFRKALHRLLRQDYSRPEALDRIVTVLLSPLPDSDSPANPDNCADRIKTFVEEYKMHEVTDVPDKAVHILSDYMEDEGNEYLQGKARYALLGLPAMCYGEHVVERQRRCIERKGSKLSVEGARRLYERERKRYEERETPLWSLGYTANDFLSASDVISNVVSASAGQLPLL